jgi:hypothetical protein
MEVKADGLSRLGAGDSGSGTGARSQFPAFLLDRGRYTAFEAPDPGVELYPFGINNRGVIVGEYIRPDSESGLRRDPDGRITSFDVPAPAGLKRTRLPTAAKSPAPTARTPRSSTTRPGRAGSCWTTTGSPGSTSEPQRAPP